MKKLLNNIKYHKLGIASDVLKYLEYEDYKSKFNIILKEWSFNEFIPS